MSKTKKWEVSYKNDLVFKYLCSRNDEDSVFIRNTIIERVTGICPTMSIVLNPEINPKIVGKKNIILDVHVRDENGSEYDIEMQTGSSGDAEFLRFAFYGAKMAYDQLDEGEDYRNLKTVYQIIFIQLDTKEDILMDHYQMISDSGKKERGGGLIHRTYIYLPHINRIAKEKGILHMNDFEQLCYLFENNAEDDILKSEERLVKAVMRKYNEMHDDNNLWSMAKAVEMGELRVKYRLEERYEEGIAEGMKEGAVKTLQQQLQHIYHEDAAQWLNTLSQEQLDCIATLIFACPSLEDLKQAIMAQ